ncbi:MAG: F0F1 ATP synthase subunit epsilon [Phycisphaerales bacterium]
MARTFRCSIVTPTEAVFDDEVIYASFPAWDGQHGVMTGQSPLLSRLGFGSLRLDFPEGGSRWYLVEGGFAQVQNGELTLLTDQATPAERLSLQEAEAELAEATARVTAASGEDRAQVVRDHQRALAKKAAAKAVEARGRAI